MTWIKHKATFNLGYDLAIADYVSPLVDYFDICWENFLGSFVNDMEMSERVSSQP